MRRMQINQMPLPEAFVALVDDRWLMRLIDAAIDEDLAERGDLTSQISIDPAATSGAQLRTRVEGQIAGLGVAAQIAKRYDQRLTFRRCLADGDAVAGGQVLAEVTGPTRSLLAAERVMLNMLSYLSGIATLTGRYVDAVGGTNARIYDTRKTLPGYRVLAKYAVRCGGGCCHRIGLYDAVLVKDNHLAAAGSINAAVERARSLSPDFVEIEVDTLDQLREALTCDVDIVLLDNMPADQLAEAVAIRDKAKTDVQLEASGGVSLESVRAIAEAGVDRIAIGALTHSAPALDIGLDFKS
jgi:nicotinate-nucleotide pyrophosphorylase (carboxylating)